jgi:hypothetical protein
MIRFAASTSVAPKVIQAPKRKERGSLRKDDVALAMVQLDGAECVADGQDFDRFAVHRCSPAEIEDVGKHQVVWFRQPDLDYVGHFCTAGRIVAADNDLRVSF